MIAIQNKLDFTTQGVTRTLLSVIQRDMKGLIKLSVEIHLNEEEIHELIYYIKNYRHLIIPNYQEIGIPETVLQYAHDNEKEVRVRQIRRRQPNGLYGYLDDFLWEIVE